MPITMTPMTAKATMAPSLRQGDHHPREAEHDEAAGEQAGHGELERVHQAAAQAVVVGRVGAGPVGPRLHDPLHDGQPDHHQAGDEQAGVDGQADGGQGGAEAGRDGPGGVAGGGDGVGRRRRPGAR